MSRKNVRATAPRGSRPASVEACERRRLFAASVPADVIAHVTTGDAFAGLVADSRHNRVFVSRGDGALSVIDTDAAAQLATVPLAGVPGALAITPDGAFLLVAEPAKHQVEIVSTSMLTSQRVLKIGVPLVQIAGGVGGRFYGIASTDAAIANPYDYDANFAARSVVQFDQTTGARTRTLEEASSVYRFIRTDTAGKRMYVGLDIGDDGSGKDVADVNVYDVSNATAVKTLAPLLGPSSRLTDVFADATTGRLYTANSSTQQVELRNAKGAVVASWSSPFDGDYDNRNIIGLAGAPGLPFVFALFDDYTQDRDLSIVAFDATSGAIRQTYRPTDTNTTATFVVAGNGRPVFLADKPYGSQTTDGNFWWVGLIGSATLRLSHVHNVVAGSVFYDLNADGVRQAGEDGWYDVPGAPPVVVYADLNNNGKLDVQDASGNAPGDEPHEFLDVSTDYRLTMPNVSGTYSIRTQIGVYVTADQIAFVGTGAALRTVTLAGSAAIDGIDFGVAPGIRVTGNVYADVDGNGKFNYLPDQSGDEPSISGAQVYIDLNDDGVHQPGEPISDAVPADNADGSYAADWSYDLVAAAGPIVVRLLNPKGYAFTGASTGVVAVDGIAGGRYKVDFTIRPQLAVSGTLYDDANANGKRDVGEGPLVGARVWLDVDGNGRFTKGEPTALTTATGRYAFVARERGTSTTPLLARDATAHPLAIAQKAHGVRFTDWKQAIVADIGAHVPATITISAFIDRDRNRKHNKGDAWLADTIVYIDANKNGKQDKHEVSLITDALGQATFYDLPPGTYVVRLRPSSKLHATGGTTYTVGVNTLGQTMVTAAVRV